MKLTRQSIFQIVFEFLSIVFAVLLALGLNSYKQSNDTKKKADVIKESIIKECQTNLEKITSVIEENKEYVAFLDSLSQLPSDQTSGFNFTYTFELLTASAWNIAQNTDAINILDQQFLLDAADIYEAQEFYMEFSKTVFNQVGIFISDVSNHEDGEIGNALIYYVTIMNESAIKVQNNLQEFLDENSQL